MSEEVIDVSDEVRFSLLVEAASRVYVEYVEVQDSAAETEFCLEKAVNEAVDLFNRSLKAFDKLD